ncbi:cation diffusion facilitator family transporter [Mesorhizobium sp. BAC0120]|uniref:cation diffusion facilitator family transporter n=1 Tax=Mesorhizobium sp. BAC0120 TaxID=3090670 RepID=UPI00298C0B1F|nr:cation diffusion facilitator family transporter [Mesorhizobium sp. BAC0120]MDW6024471.1 cation diffusion facilitator family transporter [Mesorhizobium sp. BAC0120]
MANASHHASHSHDHNHDHDDGAHSHGHQHGPGHVHVGTDKTRVLIAACLTGGFMVAEALGGWLTGSLALVADAGHMLTDTVSLLLAWYAFKISDRPGNAQLTYGFDRVKTLVAYTNGVAIFAIALWICYEAVVRFIEPTQVLAGPMLWVASAGLCVNIAAFFVLHGGDREGLNMRGAILHVVGDLLGSVAAIAAALIILATGWMPADPILSVLVAVLILGSAWRLMRDAAHVLLEGAPPELDREGIASDLVKNIAGLREIHHVHLWSLDGSRTMATLHVCLAEGADSNIVVREVKARLATEFSITHATVEPEYGHCADAGLAHPH